MKKLLSTVFLAGLLTVLLHTAVFAGEATVDTSTADKGYVTATFTGVEGLPLRVQVEKGSESYNFPPASETVTIPLIFGAGDYKIMLFEGAGGNQYRPVSSGAITELSVPAIDENALYTVSIQQINYAASTTAIPALKNLMAGQTTPIDQATAVYNDIVTTFSYDVELAAKVGAGQAAGYVPVIDTVYSEKKGICYGYSAVFGGALRSQGIPTRMVQGYIPELPGTFHAWNEVLIDGKWVATDLTIDAEAYKAGAEYQLARDRSSAQVVRIF
ncbi:MAG: transglutaminase domain-containing protein [Clostridiales bacterium]|jgi:transglutaminase-like putative cysteine protease|nr:transglutaminase domain-containing protein [Clostridiales bacterium]